jgi:hypothetical protein
MIRKLKMCVDIKHTPSLLQSSSKSSLGDNAGSNADDLNDEEVAVPSQDSRPRVDICPLITESLISEISDKNWKVILLKIQSTILILNECF